MNDAEKEVVDAARAWARTRLTRTSQGARDRLIQAVKNLEVYEEFHCFASIYHGPGHQSRTLCTRRDVHDLDDEHYAPNPMEPGFNWIGEKATQQEYW